MIRLGCYEFIACKGNVFKRIRKTKTHACLCWRYYRRAVICLRANRAAVRGVWHYWRRCTQRLYCRLCSRKKQLSPQGMFSRGESLSYKGGFAVTSQLLFALRCRYGQCTRRQSHEWCVRCRGKPVRLACHTRSFRLPCR